MNTNRNNRQLPRVAEEKNIIDSAHRAASRGALLGGAGGTLAGYLAGGKKRKIAAAIGGLTGAVVGDKAGRQYGIRTGAKDVIAARKALNQQRQLAALTAEVRDLAVRAGERDAVRFETVDGATAKKPVRPGQHPTRIYPKAKGPYIAGNGIDDQGEYELTAERQRLAEIYGWGVVSALDDDQLTEANCERLHQQVLDRQARANGPHAGGDRSAEFERNYFAAKLGHATVARMGAAEMHALFVAHQRNGLVEFEDQNETTDFAILNRSRTPEGTFAPDDQVSSAAVRKAYSRDSVTAKAASSDPHTGRDATLAGAVVGAAGLAGRALLKGRKGRLKLPPGVAKIAGSGAPKSFAMTSAPGPGTYPIRRAKLKGKKQPGVPKVAGGKRVPKPARHNMALLIADDDPAFRLDPVKPTRLAPGMHQRVKPARNRKEVLARLKEITQLASRHDLGLGAAVAEGAIDALGIGEATTPKKRRLLRDANGNILNPQFLKDPGVTSTSSFSSALRRLHEFGIGSSITSGAGRFLPEIGAVAGGDLIGESLHDRIVAARQRKAKKARMQVRGGIEAQGPPGPTALAAILGTLNEFSDDSRDRARRRAGDLGAAGVGAAAGGYGAMASYRPGRPAHPGEDLQGKRVFVKRKSVIPSFHVGVGGENGVVHRSPGRGDFREVKRDTFRRNGTGGLRVEDVVNGKTPRANARAASAAAGTKAGPVRYRSEQLRARCRPHSGRPRCESPSPPWCCRSRRRCGPRRHDGRNPEPQEG